MDADTVGQVVRAQFPAIDAAAVEPLGEGWDFQVYLVDRRWVFRFPKRREYDFRLLTEATLLDEIAEQVTLPLPVPRYEFRGRPSALFPYHFGGYARLPGEPATVASLSPSAAGTVAAQLGRFLDCLHRCDVERLWALNLYGPENHGSPETDRPETLGRLDSLADAIAPSLHERCVQFFQDAAGVPAPYAGPLRLSHGDLLPEHILLDPAEGSVTGIIDWSDASIADPKGDFVGLWMWRGDAFVAEVMNHYSLPIDAGMWRRIRYRGLSVILGELHYALAQGRGEYAAFCEGCLRGRLAEP